MNTIQDDLKKLSRQIQEYEKSYLEDTMYYGNVVIGWSEEGFQKAEEDKTTKKVVDIDPGQRQFPSASADASYNIVQAGLSGSWLLRTSPSWIYEAFVPPLKSCRTC